MIVPVHLSQKVFFISSNEIFGWALVLEELRQLLVKELPKEARKPVLERQEQVQDTLPEAQQAVVGGEDGVAEMIVTKEATAGATAEEVVEAARLCR